MDHPNLDCQVCLRLYEQGDLESVPCDLCPTRLMPEPDEITLKANEVYAYMARYPIPEQMDLTFIFTMAGLRVGSDEAKAVWERLLDRLQIEAEYREKRAGGAATNGHQPEHGARQGD
jgi:hypothetical protein